VSARRRYRVSGSQGDFQNPFYRDFAEAQWWGQNAVKGCSCARDFIPTARSAVQRVGDGNQQADGIKNEARGSKSALVVDKNARKMPNAWKTVGGGRSVKRPGTRARVSRKFPFGEKRPVRPSAEPMGLTDGLAYFRS